MMYNCQNQQTVVEFQEVSKSDSEKDHLDTNLSIDKKENISYVVIRENEEPQE